MLEAPFAICRYSGGTLFVVSRGQGCAVCARVRNVVGSKLVSLLSSGYFLEQDSSLSAVVLQERKIATPRNFLFPRSRYKIIQRGQEIKTL